MALAVITVASGGLPVVDATASGLGLPVSEMPSKFGLAVTKVAAGGRPVVYAPANSDGSPPVIPPFTATTWNPADKTNVTLSNSNLTATFSASNGIVRSVSGLSTGKYYFEYTLTTWASFNYVTIGLALLSIAGGSPSTGAGTVWIGGGTGGTLVVNGSNVGSDLGTRGSGTTVAIAVNLTSGLVWGRICPVGNWNGVAGNNPATGVGGGSLSGTLSGATLYPYAAQKNASGDIAVANFGASAFSGAVPSGFTAGWPA